MVVDSPVPLVMRALIRIVLAMIVENAGFGGAAAAPIARKVLDYWLLGKRSGEKDTTPVPKEDAETVPVESLPAEDVEAAAAAIERRQAAGEQAAPAPAPQQAPAQQAPAAPAPTAPQPSKEQKPALQPPRRKE